MRIPLMMLKYLVSERTNITFGLQGIPGFTLTYKDFVQDENDYTSVTYALQLENRTVYFGYNIWASTGLLYDTREYEDIGREFESYKSSTLFVRILLGW